VRITLPIPVGRILDVEEHFVTIHVGKVVGEIINGICDRVLPMLGHVPIPEGININGFKGCLDRCLLLGKASLLVIGGFKDAIAF
jgi:hypothetical protein